MTDSLRRASRPVYPQRRLLASLADSPSYEPYGDPIRDPWGSAQWVRFTDPDGREHYSRVVVERYREPD